MTVWWSSTAEGKGTNSAAAPTAAISVTVLAPARQMIRSASAKAWAVSSMKGRQFGLHASGLVVGAQRFKLAGAALVGDLGTRCRGNQRQRLGNQLVQGGSAQAAADHQQLERPAPLGKADRRAGLAGEGRAQRIAHPLGFFKHIRKGGKHTVGHAGQHLVDHAGHRILLVQHQRLAQQHAHHAGRKGDVAAQARPPHRA